MSKKPLITISILLKGDELNPIHVTKTLGIQPNESQEKGERRGGIRPNSKEYVAKTGNWWIWVDNKSRIEENMINVIPQMIDELFQVLYKYETSLKEIVGVKEAYLDILILQDKKKQIDNTAEFTLNNVQMLKAAQLGLAMCVTVSFSDDK